MKTISDLIHRTPWWLLIIGGVLVLLGLGVFVTPFHLIEYRHDGATAAENTAIRREVDNTLAEGAVDIARNTILAMRRATSDPARRAELDRALEELDSARVELRDASRESRDARREATREAFSAVEEARRSAERALQDAGVEGGKVKDALEKSLNAAREAEEEARKALEAQAATEPAPKRIVIDIGLGKDKPLVEIEPGKPASGDRPSVEVLRLGDKGARATVSVDIDQEATGIAKDVAEGIAEGVRESARAAASLPPELRAQIRQNVSHDLKKLGVGAALVLLFVPLFILTAIAKFFIDRSRAAQRLAELKRKEAEYHRMSQQVTEAKLQALQAQVEPHFLYNTLANVQALTEVDPVQAHTMVGHLIQYLRNALPKMRESVSTVGQEVELVRSYLSILQMRMGRRLSFEIDVPEALLARPFPPLMLPSLVENAIKHGLEPQREGGSVRISAESRDGRLRLVVADSGRGFGEIVGSGVGLENIRERLAALYGDAGRLTLEANTPNGVVAAIEMPEDGLRATTGAGTGPAQPEKAKTATGKVISAVGTAERVWRRSLSFTFSALVIIAAVIAGLAIFGVTTGLFPMTVEPLGGAASAGMSVVVFALAFAAVVLALAIVVAVIYGLGWLLAGLAVFIPVVVLIATLPATAPFILIGLLVWWLYRRRKGPFEADASQKVEPTMQAAPGEPPAAPPGNDRPAG